MKTPPPHMQVLVSMQTPRTVRDSDGGPVWCPRCYSDTRRFELGNESENFLLSRQLLVPCILYCCVQYLQPCPPHVKKARGVIHVRLRMWYSQRLGHRTGEGLST
jgi:hypothetical protein